MCIREQGWSSGWGEHKCFPTALGFIMRGRWGVKVGQGGESKKSRVEIKKSGRVSTYCLPKRAVAQELRLQTPPAQTISVYHSIDLRI